MKLANAWRAWIGPGALVKKVWSAYYTGPAPEGPSGPAR